MQPDRRPISPYRRSVPLPMLLKAVLYIGAAPLLMLGCFMLMGYLPVLPGLYGAVLVLMACAILIRPYLSSIVALTDYVDGLSQDRRVEMPDLRLLIGDLPSAVNKLHRSWERRKQEMEAVIDEREILVDSIPDILIMIDSAFTIVRTNAAARQCFGQSLAHKKLEQVADNEALLNAVREAYEEGADKDVEFYLNTPIEGYFRARIDHFPISSPGGIAVIITMHDITELKRTEQMRADFVANASHEIRTPLASLVGFIETLQGPAKDDPEAQEQFLGIMHDQAQRMAQLVNDLLSLSKIEMNANSVPEGIVDVLQLIRNAREHCEWQADKREMNIQLAIPDQLPLVQGEENELMQVLQNLMSNAVKYGRAGSDIMVTAELTRRIPHDRQITLSGPAIKISVHDQGEGIAKEHLPRLTERFYRVNNATTRKATGTGLGLAIVKHILLRHRGILHVESTVGVGSCFSVYLPILRESGSKERLV